MAIGNKVIVKILEIVIFVGVIVNLLICINKCDFNIHIEHFCIFQYSLGLDVAD